MIMAVILYGVYFFVNFMQQLALRLWHKYQIITYQKMFSIQSANTWYQRLNFNAALWVCMFFYHIVFMFFFLNLTIWSNSKCSKNQNHVLFTIIYCVNYFLSKWLKNDNFVKYIHFCIDHCSVKKFWAIRYVSITNFMPEMHFILTFASYLHHQPELLYLKRLFER